MPSMYRVPRSLALVTTSTATMLPEVTSGVPSASFLTPGSCDRVAISAWVSRLAKGLSAPWLSTTARSGRACPVSQNWAPSPIDNSDTSTATTVMMLMTVTSEAPRRAGMLRSPKSGERRRLPQ